MSVFYDEINIETNGEVDIVDITGDIQKIINKSKIKDGIICVFVPGSTGTITTIEYEPGLMKDLPRALQKIPPTIKRRINLSLDQKQTWRNTKIKKQYRTGQRNVM